MTTNLRWFKGLIGSGALVLLASSVPVVKADVIFNAESVFSNTFGTLDATTGVFTAISTGPLNPAVAGLGEVGGVLYATDYESVGQLYSIDPGTGIFTAIGSATGISYYDFGATLTTLFVTDTSLNLYSVDPGTGVAMLIGATGLPTCSGSQLSNNSNTLYTDQCGNLYTIDPATAAPTLIGPTGNYDALSIYGGTLYGAGSLPGTVDTVDTTTGNPTTGPAVTGTPNSDLAIFGIAPSAVPEPGTFLLLAAALAALPLLRRRKA